MEIIDGQHRFQALKELNWPIMYYVDDAVTGADLITINNTQKNWGMLDYIHYYASLGNVTFKTLEKVVKAYDEFPLKVILSAIGKNRLYNNIILKYGTENYGNAEQCALVLEHFYNFHAKQYRYISNEILPKR